MQDYPADVGTLWVADEMQVKVGGKNLWHRNVMDVRTRCVLASRHTPNRDTRAAVAVMRKAAKAAQHPPKTIKTDRLGSYPTAVEDAFPDDKHVKSDGIRALINNLSERLQGTYRQRTKTLRGLDNLESGQRYLDGWTLTHNLFRGHEGIDFQTPGEMASVNAPFTQWEDVGKQHPPAEGQTKTRERDTVANLPDGPLHEGREPKGRVTLVPDPTARRRPKGKATATTPTGPMNGRAAGVIPADLQCRR